MNDSASVPVEDAPSWLVRTAQTIVCLILIVIAIAALVELRKSGTLNAPLMLMYINIAVWLVLAALHMPKLFFCLPRKVQQATYIAIVPASILFSVYLGQIDPLYAQTAGGKEELAARAETERKQAEEEKVKRELADLADANAKLEAHIEKLQGCLSFSNRLSALEDPAKEAMHNPDAFEHVETRLIEPDSEGRNVEMRFRAENGFGAIRTGRVYDKLIAEDCSVVEIGQPTVD